jgi:ABC-2 type transport system ATP-binding protein
VDPVSRREFWRILRKLADDGLALLVSTPYMDEADRCSRVGLMYAGVLVECDTPQNIRGKLEKDVVQIQAEDWQKTLETVADLEGVSEAQTYGEAVNLLVDNGEKRLPQIERVLKKSKIEYRSLRIAPARMEEAFISLIRRMEE